ncbi:hypothetical protein HZA75_04125 [Candidatus Roizmanbacteria bacterium]|nr:hypothetical protein [Candidatus Roizmanbacteria bacterium]
MSRAKPQHFLIEAAHFYAGDIDTLSSELVQGVQLANKLIKILNNKGYTTESSLFIDDTALAAYWNGENKRIIFESRSIRVIQEQIMDAGYAPAFHFIESHFEKPARMLAEQVVKIVKKHKQYQLSEDGRKIIDKESDKRIKLFGKNGNSSYPSCEMLDLCLYQEKLLLADIAITILPKSYKSQQEKVKKLSALLQLQPAVIVVYFSEDGKVSEVDFWSEKLQEVGETLFRALQV